jgi:hypothetical protein
VFVVGGDFGYESGDRSQGWLSLVETWLLEPGEEFDYSCFSLVASRGEFRSYRIISGNWGWKVEWFPGRIKR